MAALLIAFLLAPAQELQDHSKDDCKKALEEFHAALKNSTDSARVAAVGALSKHVCSAAIAAIGNLLASDSDSVRQASAKALGAMDHPKSLEVLSSAVPAKETNHAVLDAVVKALEKLDWEAGAEPLNALLPKFHEKGLFESLHSVVVTLGKLGSSTSVDPLLRLLEHAESEGKATRTAKVRSGGNSKLLALEGPIRASLKEITGGDEPNSQKWKDWWRQNRDGLLEKATLVFRCKATGKRYSRKAGDSDACPSHEKPEKDGQLIKTLLHGKA